ncbi:MAG: VanW family protein [Lachnospiraceae bacterium]|nr:VanW family protein [Lachnospiraceae bacterium]
MSIKKIIISISALAAVIFAAGAGMTALASDGDHKYAPEGVSIEGIDVSGYSQTQIRQVVDDYLSQYDGTKFTLTAADKSLEVDCSQLGFSALNADVADRAFNYGNEGNLLERFEAQKNIATGKGKDFSIALTCDVGTVKEFLKAHDSELSTPAINGSLKRENGSFTYVDGQTGTSVKINKSAVAVAEFVTNDWDGKDATIELVTKVEEPEGSKETLSKVKDLLGSFSTDFHTSSAARAQNVKNGASKIDGTVLYPGEEFSVATALNPMTAENGYALAASYENGTTVETYGGGICQVSTTLYNAVMRAELEIVTRSAHSMIVSYVKPSMDAAIAGDSKDFVFKNNQEYPVYIEGYTNGGMIYFNVFGVETRDPSRSVEFESEILSQTDPIAVFEAAGDQPVGTVVKTSGSAHTGYTARLWKVVYENGTEVSRDVYNNSKYRVTNNIYAVGTQSDNPDAVAAINAAIATQDEETVRAAAAQWGGDGTTAAEDTEESAKKKEDSESSKKTEESEKKEETVSETPAAEEVPEETTTPAEEQIILP